MRKTYHYSYLINIGLTKLKADERFAFHSPTKFSVYNWDLGKRKLYQIKSLKRMCNYYCVGHKYEQIKEELETLIEEYILRKL